MKVVNLFGGPGCGKSTTAAALFYQMKMKHMNVELVTEFAKDLVYSGILAIFSDRQEFLFAEQERRQQILRKHVDWAITDSPILLSYFYGAKGKPNQDIFLEFVTASFNTYDNINFVLRRPVAPYQEVGRDHNLQQAIEIDEAMIAVLNKLNIPYTVVEVNANTTDVILSHLI